MNTQMEIKSQWESKSMKIMSKRSIIIFREEKLIVFQELINYYDNYYDSSYLNFFLQRFMKKKPQGKHCKATCQN